jgi:hypothetical protein
MIYHSTLVEKVMSMSEAPKTYSILLHVRRIIHEDAYVAVPVTDAIMMTKADGTAGIDPEALIAEAIRISTDPRVEWRQESSLTEPHPIQQPLPEDRTSFDAFYADSTEPE